MMPLSIMKGFIAAMVMALFLPALPAHAENGCPDNYRPTPGTYEVNGVPQACEPMYSSAYTVDSYIAAAGHPDSSDVWVAWNARYQETAENKSMEMCTAAMGSGCVFAGSGRNSTIAIMRVQDGTVRWGWGANVKDAKRQAFIYCKSRQEKCQYLNSFTAKPWQEQRGGPQYGNPKLYAPPVATLRKNHGAVAWINNASGTWGDFAWVGGGYASQDEAMKTVIAECERVSGQKCSLANWNVNGFITLARDSKNAVRAVGDQSKSLAEAEVKSICKKAKEKCFLIGTFDMKKSGIQQIVTRGIPGDDAGSQDLDKVNGI
jgi:Domain of unknown function (DUF4189)